MQLFNGAIMSPNYKIYNVTTGRIREGKCRVVINNKVEYVNCLNDTQLRESISALIQDLDTEGLRYDTYR